ncbi:MAG: ATP-binding protein, partial [Desulfuromonadaceae bacterium]|nr:ATP-binding protein [Desulfuromonadaceae bacterium]
IRSGLRALERLGMCRPEETAAAEVTEAMARAFTLLQQRTIEELIDLPLMTSPEQLASLSLLSEIGEPAYAASPHFFLVWASSMAELSLRYGNSPLSPFAYAAHALALCATGEIETGSRLSRAAISMIDTIEARSLRCRLLNIHGCTIQPWTEPLRDTLGTLAEAVGAGAESGDFTSASYAAFNSCTAAFFMGEPLEDLGVRVSNNLKIIAGLRQTYIRNWVAFHLPVIRLLHGEENFPTKSDGFDEASWLSAARDANDRCGLAYYFLGRLVASYLLGDGEYAESLAHIAGIKENQAGFQGAFAVPVFLFYSSLTVLKRHGMPQTGKDATSLEEVRGYLTRLDGMAAFAPMNFRHKCDLIEAELARIQGEDWRAAGQYEKAIVGARDNGFIQEEALANELAAKFYLAHGREECARMHLEKAHRGYGVWQAFAKVTALEAEYPHWLKRTDTLPAPETHSLDMESILKATHAISGEIEMGKVLDRVMSIVIENAGAQTGFLLKESDGAWTIAARGEIGRSDVAIPPQEPVDDSGEVSTGVVNFVAHTRKTVVLDDAACQGAFVDDPHIRREKSRSLLAIPLSSHGRLLGILYLVNNLATHTFTEERVQLLEMLAAQAAISLETAGIYEALRLNEMRYRLGQTTAHIGAWEYDMKSEFFWGSDEAKRIYGFPLERPDFTLDEVEACIPERQRVHQALLDLIDHGAPYDLEFKIRPVDGSETRMISSIAELYRDDQGTPLKVVGVIQDITLRKQAEEMLHIQTVELEEEVAGRQMAQETLQDLAIQLKNEIDEHRLAQDELEVLNESLEERVKERTAELDKSQRALMNIVGDLNQQTAELEDANSKLQELDRMKSMFIASMSHELRTPLNSVIGFSRILLDEWTGSLNREQKENLATVLRSGKHLLSLVNNVIDVSKIEAGMIDPDIEDFDINDVISEAEKSVGKDISDNGIVLTAQAIHHIMHTDRTRLLQCLLNLLSNAVKYTEKGTITICAQLVDNGGLLELTVVDTGIGIAEDDLGKLFFPFVRLDSPMRTTVPGTGLGLYLTRKLAREVLRGEIAVTSTPGVGSSFVLTVPVSLPNTQGGIPA